MTEIPYSFYFHQFSNTTFRSLVEMIKKSDFLISDEKCTHRLVGLKYNEKMFSPQVCCIVSHRNIILAEKQVLIFGKKIFPQNELSASIFRNYCCGENLREYSDLLEAAKLYAKFLS